MTTKKTIYLIRHGQTDYNKQGIIQGSGINSDLNDHGRNQAQLFFDAYHHVPFDRIYASELKRTQQTVEPFVKMGKSLSIHPGLNEINWGIMEGLKASPEQSKQYERIIKDWKAGLLDRTIGGGESPNQMFKRQREALEEIRSVEEDKIVLVAMHGRAMRSFLCLLTGSPLKDMDRYKHSNVCLYILQEIESGFKIVVENSTSHLWVN